MSFYNANSIFLKYRSFSNQFFSGAPQVLRHTTVPEVFVEKGENARLSMVVCADPRPRIVAWEWGSLRLEAGSEMGRK